MPSIYLHNYFSNDIYNRLKKENIIVPKDKSYFLLFSQSFDYLFSYNFLSIKKGKKIRNLGHYAHTHKVWDYFENMLTYMKKNNMLDDGNISYLYGSLSHYALDATFHPYVHYISGRFSKKNKKDTKKYMGKHAINEIMLDAIFYYKNNSSKYYKYKLYKDNSFFKKIYFDKKIQNTINYVFKKTFNVDNMGYIYNKSYLQYIPIYKYLMHDRTGLKKLLYKIIDFLTPFKNFKSYSYSHHINKPNLSILNNDNEEWLHPITGEKHNESVEELYNIAAKKLITYIKISNDYLNGKCTINKVKRVIGNNSYSTNLDTSERGNFQYFKY